MNRHICEQCGKVFFARAKARRFCSKTCNLNNLHENLDKNGQPCFLCEHATGGCSWSDRFIPVEGWDAEPTIINEGDGRIVHSFKIKKCPLYVFG